MATPRDEAAIDRALQEIRQQVVNDTLRPTVQGMASPTMSLAGAFNNAGTVVSPAYQQTGRVMNVLAEQPTVRYNYSNPGGTQAGHAKFGAEPPLVQKSPYATATHMVNPVNGSVRSLVGYASEVPHVLYGGWSDTAAPYMQKFMDWASSMYQQPAAQPRAAAPSRPAPSRQAPSRPAPSQPAPAAPAAPVAPQVVLPANNAEYLDMRGPSFADSPEYLDMRGPAFETPAPQVQPQPVASYPLPHSIDEDAYGHYLYDPLVKYTTGEERDPLVESTSVPVRQDPYEYTGPVRSPWEGVTFTDVMRRLLPVSVEPSFGSAAPSGVPDYRMPAEWAGRPTPVVAPTVVDPAFGSATPGGVPDYRMPAEWAGRPTPVAVPAVAPAFGSANPGGVPDYRMPAEWAGRPTPAPAPTVTTPVGRATTPAYTETVRQPDWIPPNYAPGVVPPMDPEVEARVMSFAQSLGLGLSPQQAYNAYSTYADMVTTYTQLGIDPQMASDMARSTVRDQIHSLIASGY